MRWWLVTLFLAWALPAGADEMLRVCYNYGCLVEADIRYSEGQLGDLRRQLAAAVDAETERKMLAEVIGQLYGWAGEQSPIANDRAGNYDDGLVSGRMDCIDHSTSTTRLLQLLAARGYMRWHRVGEPAVRHFALVIPAHWSAVIEEVTAEVTEAGAPRRFVVDSWFVDNGQPAVILPLEEWKKGAGPDV